MNDKPKIVLVENSRYLTGGFNALLSLTERLRGDFDFVYVLDTESTLASNLQGKGYTVYQLPFLELSRSAKAIGYLPRLWRNARRLIQILKKENAQILHVNDLFNQLGSMVKLLRPKTKLVYHVRLLKTSYIAPLYPLFTKGVRRFADQIICVSKAVMQDIGSPSNAVVLYDAPLLTHQYTPWNGLQDPEKLNILYLGNYMQGKGQDLGLETFIKLQQQHPHTRLTFAGDTNGAAAEAFKAQLQARAQEAGVGTSISWQGKTTDVEATMKAHDVVLNMSESESFSFVCLEALLYGVPLVAANSGGPAEITEEGRQAALVPNKDTAAAAAALAGIIGNPEEAIRLSDRARKWSEKTFDPNAVVLDLRAIYKKVSL